MGVRGLWKFIAGVQEYRPVNELSGEVLAVDLSIWICGDLSIKFSQQVTSKLHLRNLLFRTLNLLRRNVLPVMVLDGVAPKLKASIMAKRQNARHEERNCTNSALDILERRRFSNIYKECCTLLDALGVPWVQSPGEAEAMCAFLNTSKLVDACITNDGDAFLYGASRVYRWFTLDSRDASVRVYQFSRLVQDLQLSPVRLVIIAVVLGCDYWPSGAPGFGLKHLRRLLASVKHVSDSDLMQFIAWFDKRRPCTEVDFRLHNLFASMDTGIIEQLWVKFGVALHRCPLVEICAEFLTQACERSWFLPSRNQVSTWARPDLLRLVRFCVTQLDWKADYVLHHVLPILALWQLPNPSVPSDHLLADGTDRATPSGAQAAEKVGPQREAALSSGGGRVVLQPIRILKKKTVQFIPSYEVEWKLSVFGSDVNQCKTEDVWCCEQNATVATSHNFAVPVVEFIGVYPNIVESFDRSVTIREKKPSGVPEGNFPKRTTDGIHAERYSSLITGPLERLFNTLSTTDKSVTTASVQPILTSQCARLPRRLPCWDSSFESDSGSSSPLVQNALWKPAFQLPSCGSNSVYPPEPVHLVSSLLQSPPLASDASADLETDADVVNRTNNPLAPASFVIGAMRSSKNDSLETFDAFPTPKCLRDRMASMLFGVTG